MDPRRRALVLAVAATLAGASLLLALAPDPPRRWPLLPMSILLVAVVAPLLAWWARAPDGIRRDRRQAVALWIAVYPLGGLVYALAYALGPADACRPTPLATPSVPGLLVGLWAWPLALLDPLACG